MAGTALLDPADIETHLSALDWLTAILESDAVQLRAAAEFMAAQGVSSLADTCHGARGELASGLAQTTADRDVDVVRIPGGTVAVREYLQTRVLDSSCTGTILWPASPIYR
jgi:hypothetical protein